MSDPLTVATIVPRPDMINTLVRQDGVHWKGEWKSSVGPSMIYGTISVSLDEYKTMADESTKSFSFETKAYVQYQGLYRMGSQTVLPLKVVLEKEPGAQATTSGVTHQQGFVQMKMAAMLPTNQTIQYTTTKFTPDEISGTYTSHNPGDQGVFAIKPSTEPMPLENEVSPCVIV